RLKRVLSKLISNCQSAFLPKRQILDGVMVLNELIDLAKWRKDECLIFKVDFERAYDTVSWKYLENMMIKMGFAEGWLRWMKACIFESTMSVLVNGSPTEDFKVSKGLRQGDPLSPFLFLIAAEGLTGLVKKAVEIGKFHGYNVHETLQFQILQFVDDTVLVGEGSWDNVWTIKTILRGFQLVSGMKINFVKIKYVEAGVWYGLLKYRYKDSLDDLLSWEGANTSSKDSIWWRDVVKIGSIEAEAEDLLHLQQLLFTVMLKVNGADSWRWMPDRNGAFSVNSTYTLLHLSRE
ncbi:LINE-1 reverse transcriptase like, partial [Trifolium medium]|nr:LINE-1 reverse transcriptase like [Trifolium medium]